MTYISTTSLQSIRLDKKFIQVFHNNLQERSNKLFGQPNRYYPNPHFTKGKLRPGAIRPLAQGDLEASWLRSLSFLEEGALRAMRNVGPGPPRVFLRQPDPRGLSEEPRTAAPFPATQHPTFPVVAHTELLLTGEPPPAHPLRGKCRPPHPQSMCTQLPLAPPLPHPPGEVGPPSRGFRPPAAFVKAPLWLTWQPAMAGRAARPTVVKD